jgi:hypothetical protein
LVDDGLRLEDSGPTVEYLVDDRLCGLGLRLLVGREGVNLQRERTPKSSQQQQKKKQY